MSGRPLELIQERAEVAPMGQQTWLLPFVGANLVILGILLFHWTSTLSVVKDSSPVTESTWIRLQPTTGQCPPDFMPKSSTYTKHASRLMQFSPLNMSVTTRTDESVLILTPICNSRNFLDHYFRLLCSLTYPHKQISIGLGEDSSSDDTYQFARKMADKFRPYFRDINVYHLDPPEISPISYGSRHRRKLQEKRRAHMAMSRNNLLLRAMEDEKWVLWIDVDMVFYPASIIEHLRSTQTPIVVPNCLSAHPTQEKYFIYDRNTWRETNSSLRFLKESPENFLQVEGYGPSRRRFLAEIVDEGLVVPLDGVGGCVLLVEGARHRDGLIFPPFVFDHHVETEGLAKMATKMNISIAGLPFVNTVHKS